MSRETIVLKFGGSVLRDEPSLGIVAEEVLRFVSAGKRVVAVVSALEGTTDALLARARAIAPEPDEDALAMLLATGELASASLLTLALSARGVRPWVLGPHALGLRTKGRGSDTDPASIDASTLTRALDSAGVAVVPGFVGVGPSAQYALLGRGGSDLTALFIAAQLSAACRLIKDVAGLFERDPALPGPPPRRYRTLGWNDALALDGGIVQHKAVRYAQRSNLTFEVGAVGREDVSTIGPHAVSWFDESDVLHEPEVAHAG